MEEKIAAQIADLINSRNQLTQEYDVAKILKKSDNFIIETENDSLCGCVEIKKVQWYQAEILHLSVKEEYEGKGIGSKLVEKGIEKAKKLGKKILQCTIRSDNAPSIALFTKYNFKFVNSFNNEKSKNTVNVYQLVL